MLAQLEKPTRLLAYLMVMSVFLYLFNNYLVYWQNLPGPYNLFAHYGLFGEAATETISKDLIEQGWTQLVIYLLVLAGTAFYSFKRSNIPLRQESLRFQMISAYIVRAAFWAVLLVGCADTLISFLRIEAFLEFWVGKEMEVQLGRPSFRGVYVHYPLVVLAFVVATFIRNISFAWLALLVVLAEFTIVLTRFVFSYEQAFMGDLVRFWYAALFLFASAYTLIHEGHVRVDVLYAGFSKMKKARTNIIGSLFLGIPLCWVILMHGMGGKGNSINSPLLSYEISQSGYGMYVKYLMAAYLVVFAVTMMIQFVSYLLLSVSQLVSPEDETADDHELTGSMSVHPEHAEEVL